MKTGSKRKRPAPKSKGGAVSTPVAKLKTSGASANTTPSKFIKHYVQNSLINSLLFHPTVFYVKNLFL